MRFVLSRNRIRTFACLLMLFLLLTVIVPGTVVSVCAAQDSRASDSENAEADEKEKEKDTAPRARDSTDSFNRKDRYLAILYNNKNGLPTSEANAIAETSDGFIWIGSYSGLVRYDGDNFERVGSEEGISSVTSLYVDSLDRLWIGTNDSGVAMLDRGKVRKWKETDGLISSNICEITGDGNDRIYVGTTTGIQMFDGDLNLVTVEDPRIEGIYVERLIPGADGQIYGMTSKDDFYTLRDGKVIDYLAKEDMPLKHIVEIAPDPTEPGIVYMGTDESMFYTGTFDGKFGVTGSVDISPLAGVLNIQKIDNAVWIFARNGIGVYFQGKFHYLGDLPMTNSPNRIMKDYEGNLWFASTRQGVMKIVPNNFSDIFKRYGLDEQVVNSTCLYEDELWIGTDTGLIVLSKEGILSEVPLAEAKTASGTDLGEQDLIAFLDGYRIRSIIKDTKNRLWISTWRGCGLLCYDQGRMTVFDEADGLLSNHIRAVCERKDGSILVALTGGVSIIEDGKVTASYGEDDGITNSETLTVAEAENGDILVGSNGGGIYVINETGTRCIGVPEGLPSGIVMRIKSDPARNLFWIVTSNAIAYMTEDYQVTTIQNFPYKNNFDMVENRQGDMWVLSSDGIYVLPTEELLQNGRLNPVHYGLANGLPSIMTSNAYNALADNGNLYIAGNTGVARVNIEETIEDITNIKIAVPFIDIDGERVYSDGDSGFHIPSTVKRLTIYSYVYNYSLIDPEVAYYLEGFDRDKKIVNRSELLPETYTNLAGGNYRFVIQLMDSHGNVGRTLSVPIVKDKALYEHVWFYALLAMGIVLLVVGAVHAILSQKTAALEKKNQEALKEQRLMTELHMANRIQGSILPHDFPPFPDRTEFEIYAVMDPAREVGGDFYDFFMIDNDHMGIVIADVSGKGIPAALFMMISKVIVQSCAMLGKSAGEILTKTNEALCSSNKVDMFVTVWIGILEISTGKISAANAGHEYPAIRKGDTFTLLKDKHGFVIGGMEDTVYTEYEIDLKPGDKLFVYTDGVPEATDIHNNMYGTERMLDALNNIGNAGPEQILDYIHESVNEFVGDAEQFDDLTMLCLEYKGI